MVIKDEKITTISISMLAVAFAIFYFSDGMGKFLLLKGAGFYRYSAIIKAFFEFVVLVYALLTIQRTKISILIVLTILLINFLIGQFFLGLNFSEINFYENFNTLFKYFFPFIFFLLAVDILKSTTFPNLLLSVYKFIMTLNGLLIILGFIFNIEVFQTYPGPWRFGYDGLIFAQNEASFIFIFALTTVYYRRFYLGIKEYFFWFILFTSLVVATKAVFLYFILLLCFHLFKKVSLKNILTFGFSALLFGYLLFSTLINKIILNSYNTFMYMYNREGLWFALFSGRNVYIQDKLFPLIFEYWSVPNYLFGGQDVVAHYIEMGLIDLALFFGIIGFVIYLYVFYRIFNLLSLERDFKIFFGFTFLLIIATAGHFFESGIAGIHFMMMLLILRSYKPDKTFLLEKSLDG